MAAVSTRSSLDASPDGQWVAVRRGEVISLLAGGAGQPVGKVDVGTDDVDVAFVGSPAMLVVVVRNVAPRVMLYQVPSLEVIGRHDLPASMRIVALTAARIVLGAPESKKLVIMRVAASTLGAQNVDLDGPLDFAVGLDKNQLLVGVQRKLEVWDAMTGRPVLRMQLQLPPPPRTVGAAQGHVWVTRPSADDLIIYRLSDGRPFRHVVGGPPTDVVASHASPVIVVGTARHLVRVHCFAHSVTVLEAPWSPGTPIAQLAVGEDISVLGLADNDLEPWRVPIAGAGAPALPPPPAEDPPPDPADLPAPDAPNRFRAMRERGEAERASVTPPPSTTASIPTIKGTAAPMSKPSAHSWREALAAIGAQLVDGSSPELVAALDDSELADLADRLLLSQRSIRALIALYGLYLVGEPALSIADLAHVLGDWSEPLGAGELGALAMLDRARGRVALRAEVTDLLDGARPRAIRIATGGHATTKPTSKPVIKPQLAGAWRFPREGKSDTEIEALLAGMFGRIAVIDGDPDCAILEARLRGATAVAFHPPAHKPTPWPRDANLVLVLYGSASSWIADLPNLEV